MTMTRLLRGLGALAYVCIAVLAATTAGAQTPAPVGAPKPEAAAVQKTIEGFMDALNAADIEKFAPFFANDATMFFPLAPIYSRLENKEQITQVFGVFFESVRKGKTGPRYMNLVPQDLRIQLFGSTAVATFGFKGPDLISRRTLVLRRETGKWQIVHMHASNLGVPKE